MYKYYGFFWVFLKLVCCSHIYKYFNQNFFKVATIFLLNPQFLKNDQEGSRHFFKITFSQKLSVSWFEINLEILIKMLVSVFKFSLNSYQKFKIFSIFKVSLNVFQNFSKITPTSLHFFPYFSSELLECYIIIFPKSFQNFFIIFRKFWMYFLL